MTVMLDAAVRYALDGFAIFPCSRKMPLTPHGFKDATLDATTIHEWWTRWPDAQIALPTGLVNRLFVLDIDGERGAAIVAKWNLPPTRIIETRPGRWQAWFKLPDGIETKCSTGILGPEIDTRGDGGYVIAPPSIHHETGFPYRIVKNVALADVPSVLIEPRKNGTQPTGAKAIPQGRELTIYEGQGRHQQALKLAGGLRARGAKPEDLLADLKIFSERHCVPPLDQAWLEKAAKYIATKPVGFRGEHLNLPAEVELLYYHRVTREQVRWLWPHRIPRGKLTLFVGDPGTGKSLAAIDLAARVSSGCTFPDGRPCERGDALILTAEDDPSDTVGPRLDAAGADSSHVARINAVKVIAPLPDLNASIPDCVIVPDGNQRGLAHPYMCIRSTCRIDLQRRVTLCNCSRTHPLNAIAR
jgi:bifunctional DNA primase/polymerase-like protein/AAA domain-containing protein